MSANSFVKYHSQTSRESRYVTNQIRANQSVQATEEKKAMQWASKRNCQSCNEYPKSSNSNFCEHCNDSATQKSRTLSLGDDGFLL